LSLWDRYRLRLRRKRLILRGYRKARDLSAVADRTGRIRPSDILVFSTLRNERVRLPYFLRYYRELGVSHFLIVDNGSDDGSRAYLEAQEDVSLWFTGSSYRAARYGMDWMNYLLRRHGSGHWTLTVDPDEFLVFPFCDTRPLRALTDWLDTYNTRSFPAMLLDMYPKGPVGAASYREGENPFDTACWFDSANYMIRRDPLLKNLRIQGGPRARTVFADRPDDAPSLNKIPLVRWSRGYAYASSTHMLLPRGLNLTYDEWGGEKISGCLLHAKFLAPFEQKTAEELARHEHYAGGREYRAYAERLASDPVLWCNWSEKFINWRQLEILGLMSKGDWA
jgi:hypothetical protein